SSSADVALLRFTSADGSAAPSPAALPPPEDGPGGAASPTRCTSTRWPSAIFAARLSRFRSASGTPPPAASMASITRVPAPRPSPPGCPTAPAPWRVPRSPFWAAPVEPPAAGDAVADPVVAGAPAVGPRRAGGDDGDPPAPSRYQTKPAASATSTSATIPTRVSPHSSRRRSANRSRRPPHGPGPGRKPLLPRPPPAGYQYPAIR